jgi:small-conductance mechanosensitive channel/CRP-like cAMP-binding protein
MTSFFLFALLLLTIILGRLRQLRTWRLSHLIPSMTFFRVALAAALIGRILIGFGFQGEIVNWFAVMAKIGLFVALAELALDGLWVLLARLNRLGLSPPRILKDLILVVAAFVVFAAELNSQGVLTTLGSAAVLGGLAFIVGPGSATQIGNISSALAVQVERQFSVGDWVEIAGEKGRVDNISWNSTYLYDDVEDRYIVIPNSFIDKHKTINYSRPLSTEYRLEVEVGLPLDMPTGKAMEILLDVLDGHSEIINTSRNAVVIRSIDDSSINYALKFFIANFAVRNRIRTEIFSSIWYNIRRAGYALPYSVVDLRTIHSSQKDDARRLKNEEQMSFELLRSIELFASLTDHEVWDIIHKDRLIGFGRGEMVVERGDVGGSMYVILQGQCSVLIDNPSDEGGMVEIAQLNPGSIFGEIAALTNDPRTASVKAVSHLRVQEISQQQIEDLFLNNQEAMAEFANVMTAREEARNAFTPEQKKSFETSLLQRMAKTFNLFQSS